MRKEQLLAADLEQVEELQTNVSTRIQRAKSRQVSFWNNYTENRRQFNALKTTQAAIKDEIVAKHNLDVLEHRVTTQKARDDGVRRIFHIVKHKQEQLKENHLAKLDKVQMHKKQERDAAKEKLELQAEKLSGRKKKEIHDKEEFKKYMETLHEKKKLHALDLEQNRARMKLMNKIRAFSVFEKHTKKNSYLQGLKEQKGSFVAAAKQL